MTKEAAVHNHRALEKLLQGLPAHINCRNCSCDSKETIFNAVYKQSTGHLVDTDIRLNVEARQALLVTVADPCRFFRMTTTSFNAGCWHRLQITLFTSRASTKSALRATALATKQQVLRQGLASNHAAVGCCLCSHESISACCCHSHLHSDRTRHQKACSKLALLRVATRSTP